MSYIFFKTAPKPSQSTPPLVIYTALLILQVELNSLNRWESDFVAKI